MGVGEGVAISDVLLSVFGLPFVLLLSLMVILLSKIFSVPQFFFNAEVDRIIMGERGSK